MDLIVDRADIHIRAVRAPTDRRDRTAHIQSRHGMLAALLPALPDFDGAVVGCSRDELDAGPAGHRAVDGVDDFAVGADAADFLAGGEVGEGEGVVCGYAIEDLGAERPLDVENGCFGVA